MSQQKESSEVNEASDEEKRDNGEILVEANTGKSAGKNSDVNEVAKKDPLTRRRELLINSGLAEVRVFLYFYLCFDPVDLFFYYYRPRMRQTLGTSKAALIFFLGADWEEAENLFANARLHSPSLPETLLWQEASALGLPLIYMD